MKIKLSELLGEPEPEREPPPGLFCSIKGWGCTHGDKVKADFKWTYGRTKSDFVGYSCLECYLRNKERFDVELIFEKLDEGT
jgi:hypothetical protein